MSTPESMDVTKSEVNEGLPLESSAVNSGGSNNQAPAAMMDTGDNVDPSCTSTTQATAESSATKMDESGPANDKGGQGGDEADSKDMSGADEGATGGESQTGAGAGAGGDERETSGVKIKPDNLPKIDIVMCFGRCQDCTLKAGVKIRYENTKSDLLLCRECQDIHLDMKVPGETKLDINEEINQHDSKDYPPEKRVPWESKNRPNYAPAQKHKYMKEKYLRRVAFENLDVPVEDLQKKFDYQQVISDGLRGGPGTIEFLIPDFQKPWAGETGVGGADDTSVDATGDNSGAGAAGGSVDITDTIKEGDCPTGETEVKESPADGGDAAMSGSDTEVESKIVESAGLNNKTTGKTLETGDHSKTSEMTEGGESEMTEGVESEMTEGGESEMTEGGESKMTEGVESEMTEGGESEMTDTNVEAGDQSGNTRSTEEVPEVGVEKPIGSVTIEGAGLEKVTYDADNIRFFGLAYNGDDSFFVQMSIELGEWNIKNYFFTLNDDTSLFQLVNNARRMMFIMRGGDHYAADFLNYMEPINRLCQVKVTKKKKTEAGYEVLWKEEKFLASLDPEYLWLKKTLHEKDEALLLAFYDHEDKEKNIINEVKLRYSHKRAWITTHIFTTNDFEYMIEACGKNDKDYHLLKSKMTRSPLPQGVLKDPPRFVDIVKYLMDIMHPVTFGVVKEKEARQKRMWLRDNPGKTQDSWDEFKMNDVEGMQKRPDIQNPPTVTKEQILASYAAKSAKSKAGLQQAKNPEQRAQDEALKLLDLNMIVKPIDSSYQEMPTPKDDDLKKKWGEFCDVYKAHQTFSTDAFDATGLDYYNEDGFDGCVSEIQTNFLIGDYTAVIHQAASLLEYYKMTLNSRIRDKIAERHLLKFIYCLIIASSNAAANVLSSKWMLDTKDVPGLAPQDAGMRDQWERFREVYNSRSVFPEDMLSQTGGFDDQESFEYCVEEIQTAFFLDNFEKVIDLSRAVLKEFNNTSNASVRQKVKENSLLKFIFKTVFGDDALPDPESLAAAAAFVDTSDVPGLAPEDEGMKEPWNTFKQVFLAREDFPPDAVKETEADTNSREGFDTLVSERLQVDFLTRKYDNVIDVARSMMDIFKKSSIAILRAAASERYLLKFIYKMIFHWPPTA